MTLQLIIAGVLVGAVVLLLARWKAGRAVAIAAFSHPLRTNVIEIDVRNRWDGQDKGANNNGASPARAGKDSKEKEASYRAVAKT